MNPDLHLLHPYPFEKLKNLLGQVTPPPDKTPINLSIGEPKHAPPAFVLDALKENMQQISLYPKTKGSDELRQAIADWLDQRFALNGKIDSQTQILPINGTREGIFSFIQAVVNRQALNASVIFPNPFYQIYEGATLLAGATPIYVNTTKDNQFLPDLNALDEDTLNACQLMMICSPGNPTGAVIDEAALIALIELADKHDFILASDECYSEIYFDEKPQGLLGACIAMGRHDFNRCVVFHSLSKRSNLPGMRSGFIAGDKYILAPYLLYRTYHGCAMSEMVQTASVDAWRDETHVAENRRLYKEKFHAVLSILEGVLDVDQPAASFYLWPRLPDDDTIFCQKLFAEEHITLVPGQYLSRESEEGNPGQYHARMALVAPLEECIEAANRLKSFVLRHYHRP
ncbi:MAG: succinyldiaminopimelate transaminase [Cellvibrionales bacterium]|nr:succinyldiaminopimelate transaminase [Cellvibrionales bacterium]